MFAFRIEREERGDDDASYLDPFVEEGDTSSSSASVSDDPNTDTSSDHTQGRSGLLCAAKNFRSTLQRRLFRAKERKRARQAIGLSGLVHH